MNVYEFFRQGFSQRAAEAADFIRAPSGETLFTYQDLEEQSARFAASLKKLGVKPGDRVIVQVPKTPQALFLYFGCLRMGAISLPLNTAYQDDELAYFITDAEPALMVCHPNKAAFFESLVGHQVVTLNEQGETELSNEMDRESADFSTLDCDDDTIAVILYTSGTTGRPKGAMISHGNLASNSQTLLDAWQWQPGDVMLHALPIFHIHGLFVASNLPVLNGSPIIFLSGFDPEQIISLMPDATVYMGVPTNYTRLIRTGKLSREVTANMRLFTSGSAPLLASTWNEFEELTGHQIVERYGMTETGMNTSNPLEGPRKPGTVGPPLPGVNVRVVTDQNNAAVIDAPGNLEVAGNNVFKGYWKLPEKTAEEFTEDGYFKTGDIASIDADGYVSIVGRDKDMIISGGLNIYPKEIESVIDRLPLVNESAVIGLPHADFGEGVCAVIVPDTDQTLDAESIRQTLKTSLANFKVPKWVFFTDQLPRNTMGKVQKNVLREHYAQQID